MVDLVNIIRYRTIDGMFFDSREEAEEHEKIVRRMTVEEIRTRLQQIRAAPDQKPALALALWSDVLFAIAEGAEDAHVLAHEALK